jgi:hypothetical protein
MNAIYLTGDGPKTRYAEVATMPTAKSEQLEIGDMRIDA